MSRAAHRIVAAGIVVLKQHRLEVMAGVLAAMLFSAWSVLLVVQAGQVSVPAGCFQVWRTIYLDPVGSCQGPMDAWGHALATSGGTIVQVMIFLPFGIGLLAGVPTVAGELDGRTAQTAWGLFGSRPRWLTLQVVPPLVVLGLAMIVLSAATGMMEADRARYAFSSLDDLGLTGWLLVPRWLAGFGVGVLLGAAVGRPLLSFVVGVIVMAGLVMAIGLAHQAWLDRVRPAIVPEPPVESIVTAVGWRSPSGALLPNDEAKRIAHAGGAPAPGRDDPQDDPAIEWLQEHGYTQVDLGVTRQVALGWGLYDAALFTAVAVAAMAAATWEVRRLRPV